MHAAFLGPRNNALQLYLDLKLILSARDSILDLLSTFEKINHVVLNHVLVLLKNITENFSYLIQHICITITRVSRIRPGILS